MSVSNVLSGIVYFFDQYFEDVRHPVSVSFPVANWTALTFFTLILSFVLFVTKIGPALMQNREPFVLKRPIFYYNILMVSLNLYIFWFVIKATSYGTRIFSFQEFDYHYTHRLALERPDEIQIAYIYFMSKFFDWIDTTFLVLRKKNSHISFLHVYHHSMVPVMGYICLTHNPLTPPGFLFALLNSLIHTIMYSYYALASLGPEMQKYLWWKKYITQLQLGQFVLLGLHAVFFYINSSGYPIKITYFFLIQPFFFFYMFFDFYIKSYKQSRERALKYQKATSNGKITSNEVCENGSDKLKAN